MVRCIQVARVHVKRMLPSVNGSCHSGCYLCWRDEKKDQVSTLLSEIDFDVRAHHHDTTLLPSTRKYA